MPKFVITKTINLGFLGERYQKGFIELRSITMREREDLIKELDKLKKDETKSFDFVKDTVLDRFVKGEFVEGDDEPQEIVKEDLMDFPSEVFLEAIAQLQGRVDPKA